MSETTTPAYEVTEELREELPAITVRKTTTMNSISMDLGHIYGQILSYLQDAGTQPAGVPFARYHGMSVQVVGAQLKRCLDRVNVHSQ